MLSSSYSGYIFPNIMKYLGFFFIQSGSKENWVPGHRKPSRFLGCTDTCVPDSLLRVRVCWNTPTPPPQNEHWWISCLSSLCLSGTGQLQLSGSSRSSINHALISLAGRSPTPLVQTVQPSPRDATILLCCLLESTLCLMSAKGAIKINFTFLPYLHIWRPPISSRNSSTVAMAIRRARLQDRDPISEWRTSAH